RLDSPTVGVDIGAKAGIFQIVDTLATRGLAILLISDEVEEVLHQSHRIMVMREGRIAATYNPHDVSEHELRESIHARRRPIPQSGISPSRSSNRLYYRPFRRLLFCSLPWFSLGQ